MSGNAMLWKHMKARNMTPGELALRTGFSVGRVMRLLNRFAPMTQADALQLEHVFVVPAQTWMEMATLGTMETAMVRSGND